MSSKEDVKTKVVKELHKPARKNYSRQRTILKGIDDLWQVDLAEIMPYAKVNKGYKYILVVIDCFSKYLWTLGVKDKSAISIRNAMHSIFKQSKRNPKNLQTDMGKEFYNKHCKTLTEKYNINHYSTYTIKKAIVERVIRALKENLYKEFSFRGKYVWYDILENVTNDYNNRKHRTIRMKPSDVLLINLLKNNYLIRSIPI